MTSVAGTSLRQEVDAFQKRFQDLRTQGKVSRSARRSSAAC